MDVPEPLLSPLLTVIAMLLGAAVVWGATKATLANLIKEVDRIRGAFEAFVERATKFETEVRIRFAAEDAARKSADRRTLAGTKRRSR